MFYALFYSYLHNKTNSNTNILININISHLDIVLRKDEKDQWGDRIRAMGQNWGSAAG